MQTASRAQSCVPPDSQGHSDILIIILQGFSLVLFIFLTRQTAFPRPWSWWKCLPHGQCRWMSAWLSSGGTCGVWEAKQLMPFVSPRDHFSCSQNSVLQGSLSATSSSAGVWLVMSLNKSWRVLFLPQMSNCVLEQTSAPSRGMLREDCSVPALSQLFSYSWQVCSLLRPIQGAPAANGSHL